MTQFRWPDILTTVVAGDDLTVSQAEWAMRQVMDGDASPAQLGGLLTALRAKGESVEEVIGFRDAILDAAVPLPVDPHVLDIVGTGGDRYGTVNISSTASIIVAATGIPVVKHGNRAVSSRAGSSDVLSELGIDLRLSPDRVAGVLDEAGITFAWAAAFHPGFKHAAPVRAELGVPTVFNFLGPLVNPARAEANAVGVASAATVPIITGVFRTRGATALVFRGEDGLDELTTTGYSRIWQISNGDMHEFDVHPRDVGLPTATIEDLLGGTPADNAATLRRTLGGESGPVRDVVLLNAAAGIVAYRLSQDPTQADRNLIARLREALEEAAAAVDDGRATAKLAAWVSASTRAVAG
ncbi:anthranilate phosphoribosyltransferase [Microbacterium excoecariae]|uniref:anthranilate phosphoribosyltransferase n=1 Tax=Microbacterium excoecariae TaxID=2715210 RepID=UPI0014079021|nr:anthranilate phosphoribosyltransferase [Microbacterium excoecariae]NHI16670.1 anthranilate phosphoribosyltransferase [Microbacterium excoecariae]